LIKQSNNESQCSWSENQFFIQFLEQKWNRSGTDIESKDGFIKIKIDGSNEEEICYSHEEMLSLFFQNHVRRRNANEGSLSKDPNLIFYGGRFWTIEE